MSIYYFCYFILFFFCLFERKDITLKTKRKILYTLCFFYSIIGGFGDWAGSDWDQYYTVFQDSTWSNIFSYNRYGDENMEAGYMLLNISIKTIFESYSFFMFFLTLFYLFTFANCFLKYTKYPILVFTIFFFTELQFCIIRQSIAVALLVWAYLFIQKNKPIQTLLVCLLAASIHNASVVFIIAYFLRYIPANFAICNAIFIFSMLIAPFIREYFVVIAMFIGGSIATKAEIYQNYQSGSDAVRSMTTDVFNLLLLNLFLYYKSKITSIDFIKWLNVVVYTFLITNCIQIVFMGAMSEFTRLAAPFRVGVYFFWGYLILFINHYHKKYAVFFYLFLIFYLVKKFYSLPLFVGIYIDNYVPYKMIFL